MSWGSKETENLRTNVENQLNRLLAQLQDLDDLQDVCHPPPHRNHTHKKQT